MDGISHDIYRFCGCQLTAQRRLVPQITPHEVRQIPGYCQALNSKGFQKEIIASKPRFARSNHAGQPHDVFLLPQVYCADCGGEGVGADLYF
jgi:hypothetical protein